jgi:hypothetical protein
MVFSWSTITVKSGYILNYASKLYFYSSLFTNDFHPSRLRWQCQLHHGKNHITHQQHSLCRGTAPSSGNSTAAAVPAQQSMWTVGPLWKNTSLPAARFKSQLPGSSDILGWAGVEPGSNQSPPARDSQIPKFQADVHHPAPASAKGCSATSWLTRWGNGRNVSKMSSTGHGFHSLWGEARLGDLSLGHNQL